MLRRTVTSILCRVVDGTRLQSLLVQSEHVLFIHGLEHGLLLIVNGRLIH